MQFSTRQNRSKQSGLTLIELMVSLVIGLLLAIVASSSYLYSKQAYNAVSENSQMEENGRLALNLLARNIQSAGFVALDPKVGLPVPSDKKLFGCTFGFRAPQTASSISDLDTCLTSIPAGTTQSGSIAMFYQTDAFDTTTTGTYQGVDCIGNRPVKLASSTPGGTDTFEVRSYFYISTTTVGTQFGSTTMGQLSCATDPTGSVPLGTFQQQPLVPGVHQLRALYLLPANEKADASPGQKAYEADAITAAQWSKVVAVDLCVLTKAIQPSGNDTATAVTDCYGNVFTPPPSQSFRRFTTTVNLRNRSPAPT